jgi:hypothetical protein
LRVWWRRRSRTRGRRIGPDVVRGVGRLYTIGVAGRSAQSGVPTCANVPQPAPAQRSTR